MQGLDEKTLLKALLHTLTLWTAIQFILSNTGITSSGGSMAYLFVISVLCQVFLFIYYIGFGWLWSLYKWINRPLVRHYESRERNYKDVISKLEQQLYRDNDYYSDKKQVQGTVDVRRMADLSQTLPSGSPVDFRRIYKMADTPSQDEHQNLSKQIETHDQETI